MDQLFTALILITVVLAAASIGLVTTLSDIKSAVRQTSFGLLILANTLLVPLMGWALATVLPLGPDARTGVILCAVCAAGPIALKGSQIARSDLAWSLTLTVVLLTLNVAAVPLWTGVLLDQSIALQPADLINVLIVAILVPVGLGILLGRWRPSSVQAWSNVGTQVSNVTLVLAVVIGIAANTSDLMDSLSAWVLVAAALIVVLGGLVGLLTPGDTARRRSSSLTTLNRATSVALLVVGRVFVDNTEVFATVVLFGLVQTVAALGLSAYWRYSGNRHLAAAR